METQGKPVSLLLVEDDELDVMAIRRALKRLRLANPLHVAGDGLEALDYLKGRNGRQRITGPLIVILDLNMPRMGGLEFLDVVRGDRELRRSVVFVLTTSKADEDILRAYDHNVAGYVVKSDPATTLRQTLEMLGYYWNIVEMPGGREALGGPATDSLVL